MRVIVTGSAGFIGNAVALKLLERSDEVVGVDNFNDYYDVSLKRAREARLIPFDAYTGRGLDIAEYEAIASVFREFRPHRVIHLAAQAGVRYSLTNPHAYVQSNLVGFTNILECCRHASVEHLVYASSSSVYGANTKQPFSEDDPVGHPKSLYAATKRANELMAHSYSSLFDLPTTGLRFFTVYGPWGRPDMALFLFTKAILEGRPIQVFNHGNHRRDFTYIDDIVDGVIRALDHPSQADSKWNSASPCAATSDSPFRVYNIGNSRPIELNRYIEAIEGCLGKRTERVMLPLQAGDIEETYADLTRISSELGYQPTTSIEVGVERFIQWYRSYYNT